MKILDLDGDGDSEFVFYGSNGLAITKLGSDGLTLAGLLTHGARSLLSLDVYRDTIKAVGRFEDTSRSSLLFGNDTRIWLQNWSGSRGFGVSDSATNGSRLGEWRLNTGSDHFGAVGDYDGDGKDEVLVSSSWGLGILKPATSGFRSLALAPNGRSLDGWRLNTEIDRFGPVGDFDGDGHDEVLVSNPWGVALLKLVGSRLTTIGITQNSRVIRWLPNFFSWIMDTKVDRFGPVFRLNSVARDGILVHHSAGVAVLTLEGGELRSRVDSSNESLLRSRTWDRLGPTTAIGDDDVLFSTPGGIQVLRLDGTEVTSVVEALNGTRALRSLGSGRGWLLNSRDNRFGPIGRISDVPVISVSSPWGIGLLTIIMGEFRSLAEHRNGSQLGDWEVSSANRSFEGQYPEMLKQREPRDLDNQYPYRPPAEPVVTRGGAEPTEHVPPSWEWPLVDYWDWRIIENNRDGVRTGRLNPRFREAAQAAMPMETLVQSVLERLDNPTSPVADALADLSVTGRRSYDRFLRAHPTDSSLTAAVSSARSSVSLARLVSAVNATLDRAYTVAWALRGDPSHRKALRADLGWIAVSSEDDAPHAPTNIPATTDHVAYLNMRIDRVRQNVSCRVSVKLIGTPPSAPMPAISTRELPRAETALEVLRSRRPDHYDRLILFVHGLGSRLEESDGFKRRLIENGLQLGMRFAVLSVDLPGFGYSTRVNLQELLADRNVDRDNHGFRLPNGEGSKFPVLAFQRDVLVQLSRQIAGGYQHVMGGSLGGNMTLWMGEEPSFGSLYNTSTDSIRSFASWSPASIWESYGRSTAGVPADGEHFDIGKAASKNRAFERMREPESRPRDSEWRSNDRNSRWNFFELMQRGETGPFGVAHILGAWGFPPSKSGLLFASEMYSEDYRRHFWATAYEQVVFSHREPLNRGRWPYSTISRPLLIATGAEDDGDTGVMDYYNNVIEVSRETSIGQRQLMKETGHSISGDRPFHLADVVARFFIEN